MRVSPRNPHPVCVIAATLTKRAVCRGDGVTVFVVIAGLLNTQRKKREMKITTYDVQWRRPKHEEILECHGLTTEQLVFRIRAVIKLCGSVELVQLTPATATASLGEASTTKAEGSETTTNRVG